MYKILVYIREKITHVYLMQWSIFTLAQVTPVKIELVLIS